MVDNIITLYRIVQHNPPTIDDMRSYHELSVQPFRDDAETRRLMQGISLYNTVQQACNQAASAPRLGGRFIAELRIPSDAPVTIERTGTQRGHHTLWGSPDGILGYVSRVFPIEVST